MMPPDAGPSRRRAIGPAISATNSDRARRRRWRTRPARSRRAISAEPAKPRPARRAPCAASSPSSSARSGRSQEQRRPARSTASADEQRAQLARAGLAHRADEPGHRLARVVDVGLGDDVADDREHELRDADPDQDEAVAGDAVAPGQQVDEHGADERADERAPARCPALPTSNRTIAADREQARARRDADEVRRGERVGEQLLEHEPGHAEGEPDRRGRSAPSAAAARAR